ncbi:hypothetical protein T492DRAFT_1039092, partial [Pavlovales sp. CCMP2436]
MVRARSRAAHKDGATSPEWAETRPGLYPRTRSPDIACPSPPSPRPLRFAPLCA